MIHTRETFDAITARITHERTRTAGRPHVIVRVAKLEAQRNELMASAVDEALEEHVRRTFVNTPTWFTTEPRPDRYDGTVDRLALLDDFEGQGAPASVIAFHRARHHTVLRLMRDACYDLAIAEDEARWNDYGHQHDTWFRNRAVTLLTRERAQFAATHGQAALEQADRRIAALHGSRP